MSLEEVGAALAAEREKKHLSIEDVANALKISATQIRAIEAGDLAALPHPAYARGFIRTYAAWLGIGNEEIQRLLDLPKSVSEEDLENIPKPLGSGSRKKAVIVLALLCIMAAAGYYIWKNDYFNLFNKSDSQPVDITEALPTADAYMAAKDNAKLAENSSTQNDIPEKETPPVEEKTPEQKNAPSAETAGAAESAAPKKNQNSDMAETAETAQPEPVTPADQHKLIITAIEECWIHSNADKTDTRQFSLRKGDTFALTFNNSLELKLGNAGGVRLRYDGKDLPAPGTSGQVKTVVFPPDL